MFKWNLIAVAAVIFLIHSYSAFAQDNQQYLDNLFKAAPPQTPAGLEASATLPPGSPPRVAPAAPDNSPGGFPWAAGGPGATGNGGFGQTKMFNTLPDEDDLLKALLPSPATKDLAVIPREQQRAAGMMILFDYNSAALTPEATRWLDRLGAVLRDPRMSGYRFELQGHTDAAGGYEYNDDLSMRRAASVAAYLSQRFGIATAALDVRGYGKRLLHDPGQPYAPINRNVKIAAIGRGA